MFPSEKFETSVIAANAEFQPELITALKVKTKIALTSLWQP